MPQIFPLATDKISRLTEYRRRSQTLIFKTVDAGEVDTQREAGWTVRKSTKSGVQLFKKKPHDEILENKFWSILYHMGYSELNIGRKFSIEVIDRAGKIITKQIDVFGKDEQTVIVAECKSSTNTNVRSLQKDIGEFSNNKGAISETIKKHYGREWKPKIIWFFVTENIRWSQEDITRAAAANIHVIKDIELRYYTEIARVLGPSARYQFHAEFLRNQPIPTLQKKKIPAIKIKLGGRPAFNFSIRSEELLAISFVNHRDLRDPAGAPTYQRLIRPGRLKSIEKFISNGGFFPNSIIVNFRRRPRFDPIGPQADRGIQIGYLELPDRYKSCWIIDGQHRLFGCSSIEDLSRRPMLSVIGFDGISTSEEAELFTTVNREQKQVSPKLLLDLDGDLKWESEIKKDQLSAIASRAVDHLRFEVGGPFFDKISAPSLEINDQPLTLPEIRKAIISSGLIGREIGKAKVFKPGLFTGASNADTLNNLVNGLQCYFDAIKDANPSRWEAGRSGYTCSNFGVPGHIRYLGELANSRALEEGDSIYLKKPTTTVKEILDTLYPLVKFIELSTDEKYEEHFKVKLGSGGVKEYIERLRYFADHEKEAAKS